MTITFTMYAMAFICAISLYAENNAKVKAKLIFNPYRVARLKEYYRLLTSGFIHGGLAHLAFNMFTMYWFGTSVEKDLGHTHFILLFVLGVIISDIPTFLKYKDVPHYNSLGASGGVAALVFCSIIYNPLSTLYIFPIPFPITGFLLGVAYLIYSYFQSKNARDNINHDAHLFGALFGVVYAFFANPQKASTFLEKIIGWINSFL